jgi:hypothetical protein
MMTVLLAGLMMMLGCASTRYTDTSRTAMEQLLISNAVDQALDRVEFPQLAGQSVFVDDKYMECVDKAYVVGCVRHRVLASGAKLADKVEGADLVLEVRSGGVGTDKVETFFGFPKIALPGPMPISLPEVKLISKETQSGTAKLGIVAYHAKERKAIGQGGLSLAKSQDSAWTFLGMGPYYSGEVREEVTSATSSASVSSEAARTAAKRGYRSQRGELANVALADGRAAAIVSAPPAATPNATVADARGQIPVRPASGVPAVTPGAIPSSAIPPGAAPPRAVSPVGYAPALPGAPYPSTGPLGGGYFPTVPSVPTTNW